MASVPTLTVIEHFQVTPPPATVGDRRSLPLTYFDLLMLRLPPVHTLFFYDLKITRSHFTQTILPNLKHSLSTTLQHFFPFAGNLFLFPTTPSKKPEIRYVEGDSIWVTFAERNLDDFNDLTGNHPRPCDKFNDLIPILGPTRKESDYIKIPVFSVQLTLFPNYGVAIGMTNHHSLCDGSSRFCFLKAWTSIARSGSDESFLANGALPIYDRLIVDQKRDEFYLKNAKIETFTEDYQLPRLSGPTDKLRATFILKRSIINRLKELVSTQLPNLVYISSFTVACAYIWSCIAKSINDDVQMLCFPIECRGRMNPPIPAEYFGNCLGGCISVAKTSVLIGKEGFLTAAKLIGEDLYKILNDKDGIVKDHQSWGGLLAELKPTTIIGVTGAPKLNVYELDFGFGKPKKYEAIPINSAAISINASKESHEDLEIGVCFSPTEMEVFVGVFSDGLETYI